MSSFTAGKGKRLIAVLLLFASGSVFSCSESPVTTPSQRILTGSSPPVDTCWTLLRSSQADFPKLNALWAEQTVPFVVGDDGFSAYYDGLAWVPLETGTSVGLAGVWGDSPSDVWAAGTGTILHYDGLTWTPATSPTSEGLNAVWGSATNDVFAVGANGVIIHYDGISWSTMTSGTTTLLLGLWGSGPTDVFAIGIGGLILHYDGADWSPMVSGTTLALFDVWGSSATDMFAVGVGGMILHYDGVTWSPMTSGTTSILLGVGGSSGTDVFAVGEGGTVLHFDGAVWSPMASGIAEQLYDVSGASSVDAVLVGDAGTILHYDGVSWAPYPAMDEWVSGAWASSGHDVVAVAGWVWHFDGSNWRREDTGSSDYLHQMFGFDRNNIFVDKSLRFDGIQWHPVGGAGLIVYDIWGSSPTDVYAVGRENWDGRIAHYDGTSWSPVSVPGPKPASFNAVGGTGPNDVYVGGWDRADIYHWDGVSWAIVYAAAHPFVGIFEGIFAIAPDNVWAVGDQILRYNGVEWLEVTSAPHPGYRDVWASAWNDVYFVGSTVGSPRQGVIVHFDGTSWTETVVLATEVLTDIWGSSPTNIIATGGDGTVVYYDGCGSITTGIRD